jgi:soluble cytochrome b562
MKLRLLLLSLSFVLVLAPGLRAQDQSKPAKSAAKSSEDETELEGKMDKLNSAYRKLGKQVNDASKNEDSLKQVAIIRENAEAALKLEPARKADIPAADQAKFVADYRAKMKTFIAEVDKLAAALKEGDNAAAAKLVDSLKTMRNEGHKEFKRPDQKK